MSMPMRLGRPACVESAQAMAPPTGPENIVWSGRAARGFGGQDTAGRLHHV